MTELLVRSLAGATLLLLVSWGISGLPIFSAASRHRIWLSGVISSLLLPGLILSLPQLSLPILPPSAADLAGPGRLQIATTGSSLEIPSLGVPVPELGWVTVSREETAQDTRSGFDASTLFLGLWLGGTTILLFRLLASVWRANRLFRRSRRLPTPTWLVQGSAADRELLQRLRLHQSNRELTPLCWGLMRPRILVPKRWSRWSLERCTLVLWHEIAHAERRDSLWMVLAHVCRALFWVSPLPWIAIRRLISESEMASDDQVLAKGIEPTVYTAHLLSLFVESREPRPVVQLAACLTGRSRGLRGRISRVLNQQRERFPVSRPSLLLLAMIWVCVLVPLCVIRATPLGSLPASQLQAPRSSLGVQPGGLLRDRNPVLREKGAWMLGDRESQAGVPVLLKSLSDAEPGVRTMAAWALGEIKDPRSLPFLVDALADLDPFVREMVVRALGEIEDPAAVDSLARVSFDPDPQLRAAVMWALGEIGSEKSEETLIRGLEDQQPLVRSFAVAALLAHPSKAKFSLLEKALEDEAPSVRREAVQVLGMLGDSRAVEALLAATRDPDPEVRWATVWALDEISEGVLPN